MSKRIHWKNEEGQALVEFALVIPLFMMLLLGILQFGIIFNNYITLTDAARAGSRVAAVSRLDSCPTCVAKTAVEDAVSGLDKSKLEVEVAAGVGGWTPGAQVTVTARYPYTIDILGKVVASGYLTSQIKERIE
jgi:Flp pilus assembly protein TadG